MDNLPSVRSSIRPSAVVEGWRLVWRAQTGSSSRLDGGEGGKLSSGELLSSVVGLICTDDGFV